MRICWFATLYKRTKCISKMYKQPTNALQILWCTFHS